MDCSWPILFAVYLASVDQNGPFWLSVIVAFVAPLQGFSNLIVYLRPKLMNKKKKRGAAGSGSGSRISSGVGSGSSRMSLRPSLAMGRFMGFFTSFRPSSVTTFQGISQSNFSNFGSSRRSVASKTADPSVVMAQAKPSAAAMAQWGLAPTPAPAPAPLTDSKPDLFAGDSNPEIIVEGDDESSSASSIADSKPDLFSKDDELSSEAESVQQEAGGDIGNQSSEKIKMVDDDDENQRLGNLKMTDDDDENLPSETFDNETGPTVPVGAEEPSGMVDDSWCEVNRTNDKVVGRKADGQTSTPSDATKHEF